MNGIMIILTLLSGVALFLFGMSLMGDGLKSLSQETSSKHCLVQADQHSAERGSLAPGTAVTSRYPVFLRNHGYGSRIRKLWYDEAKTGYRYHHGS